MILATLLLLLLPAQAGAPPAAQQPDAWWQQLPSADKERMHRRWQDYQRLSPENRAALRLRFQTLERERSLQWRRLGERERKEVEGFAEPERRRWLDERVRERLHERRMNWDRLAPDRARQDLEAAVQEGWLGAAASEWLRQAPPEELLSVMGQVQRWRFLQKAETESFWQQKEVSPELKAQLLELPAPFFFDAIRRLEQGEKPLAPPADWRRNGVPGRPHHER